MITITRTQALLLLLDKHKTRLSFEKKIMNLLVYGARKKTDLEFWNSIKNDPILKEFKIISPTASKSNDAVREYLDHTLTLKTFLVKSHLIDLSFLKKLHAEIKEAFKIFDDDSGWSIRLYNLEKKTRSIFGYANEDIIEGISKKEQTALDNIFIGKDLKEDSEDVRLQKDGFKKIESIQITSAEKEKLKIIFKIHVLLNFLVIKLKGLNQIQKIECDWKYNQADLVTYPSSLYVSTQMMKSLRGLQYLLEKKILANTSKKQITRFIKTLIYTIGCLIPKQGLMGLFMPIKLEEFKTTDAFSNLRYLKPNTLFDLNRKIFENAINFNNQYIHKLKYDKKQDNKSKIAPIGSQAEWDFAKNIVEKTKSTNPSKAANGFKISHYSHSEIFHSFVYIDHVLYIIKRATILGHGSYGFVKIVQDENDNGYAIKIEDPRSLDPGDTDELRIIKKLGIYHGRFTRSRPHESLDKHLKIRIKDKQYSITDLYQGSNLYNILKKNKSMSSHDRLMIGLKVVEAFKSLHTKGIIHADIKADNIMCKLPKYFSNKPLKPTDIIINPVDFGLSQLLEPGRNEKFGIPLGCVSYMAPEISNGIYSRHSDNYSIGKFFHLDLKIVSIPIINRLTSRYPKDRPSLEQVITVLREKLGLETKYTPQKTHLGLGVSTYSPPSKKIGRKNKKKIKHFKPKTLKKISPQINENHKYHFDEKTYENQEEEIKTIEKLNSQRKEIMRMVSLNEESVLQIDSNWIESELPKIKKYNTIIMKLVSEQISMFNSLKPYLSQRDVILAQIEMNKWEEKVLLKWNNIKRLFFKDNISICEIDIHYFHLQEKFNFNKQMKDFFCIGFQNRFNTWESDKTDLIYQFKQKVIKLILMNNVESGVIQDKEYHERLLNYLLEMQLDNLNNILTRDFAYMQNPYITFSTWEKSALVDINRFVKNKFQAIKNLNWEYWHKNKYRLISTFIESVQERIDKEKNNTPTSYQVELNEVFTRWKDKLTLKISLLERNAAQNNSDAKSSWEAISKEMHSIFNADLQNFKNYYTFKQRTQWKDELNTNINNIKKSAYRVFQMWKANILLTRFHNLADNFYRDFLNHIDDQFITLDKEIMTTHIISYKVKLNQLAVDLERQFMYKTKILKESWEQDYKLSWQNNKDKVLNQLFEQIKFTIIQNCSSLIGNKTLENKFTSEYELIEVEIKRAWDEHEEICFADGKDIEECWSIWSNITFDRAIGFCEKLYKEWVSNEINQWSNQGEQIKADFARQVITIFKIPDIETFRSTQFGLELDMKREEFINQMVNEWKTIEKDAYMNNKPTREIFNRWSSYKLKLAHQIYQQIKSKWVRKNIQRWEQNKEENLKDLREHILNTLRPIKIKHQYMGAFFDLIADKLTKNILFLFQNEQIKIYSGKYSYEKQINSFYYEISDDLNSFEQRILSIWIDYKYNELIQECIRRLDLYYNQSSSSNKTDIKSAFDQWCQHLKQDKINISFKVKMSKDPIKSITQWQEKCLNDFNNKFTSPYSSIALKQSLRK